MNRTPLHHPRATVLLLAFAQLIIALDYNIVFVALPEIRDALPFSESGLQWVVSGYAVVFGGFLLLGGRLGDLFGRRRLFIVGLLFYGLASLAGGWATEPWMLVAARAGQGIGGALLSPATLALVTTVFAEGHARNRALGIWAAAGSTGMVVGSLLGGVLTSALGWEAVFFVNVPLTGVAMASTLFLIPKDERGNARVRLDVPGALTSTLGVLAVVFGMVQLPEVGWASPSTLLPLATGVVLLCAFVAIERRSPHPLVPLRLFHNAGLRLGTVTTFMFMASFGALPYFLTIYLQAIWMISPFATGIIFMLPSACVLIGTVIGGRLASVWPHRRILASAWIVGAITTFTLVTLMVTRAPLWIGLAPIAILSLAQGIIFTTMFAVATATVPANDQGVGSGIATSGQQVGGAVGLAVLLVLAPGTSEIASSLGLAQFEVTAAGMLGIVLFMVLAVLTIRPGPAESSRKTSPSLAFES